jgi:hypothetical protein
MHQRSKLPEPSPGVAPPQETLTDTELHKGRPLFLTGAPVWVVTSLKEALKICQTLAAEKAALRASADATKDKE